jgi:hypothetical protein
MYGERTGAFKVLVGKPVGKRPLGRPRRRLRILRQIFNKQDGGEDWSDLAQDRDTWRAFVNTVMILRV